MVKNHSKKTFKRKNKISRRKSSKRKHRRNKKKNKDKTKRANDYGKAGMQPQSPQVSLPAYPLRTLREHLGDFPSGDSLTESRIGHNSLDDIREKINKSNSDTVYVLVVSNHGTMREVYSPPHGAKNPATGSPPGRRTHLSPLPDNLAIVFNILPGYSVLGDPETSEREFIAEDIILKSLSDNIENFEALDNLFDGGGCLSEKGERLNSQLATVNHYVYNGHGAIVEAPTGEATSLISMSETSDASSEKTYGILHKLQVYKGVDHRYSNLSFSASEQGDKEKLGFLFKFKAKNSNFIYTYHNLESGGFNFSLSGAGSRPGQAVTLAGILNHIEPLTSSLPSKNFIITYYACRDIPSELQRTQSKEHGNSDSIDCYVKQFDEPLRSRLNEILNKMGFINMIDFFEYLRDNDEMLDTFVKLEDKNDFFKELTQIYRVMHSHEAESGSYELNINEGDIVVVTDMDEEPCDDVGGHWWRGYKRESRGRALGRKGYVPSSYLELCSDREIIGPIIENFKKRTTTGMPARPPPIAPTEPEPEPE